MNFNNFISHLDQNKEHFFLKCFMGKSLTSRYISKGCHPYKGRHDDKPCIAPLPAHVHEERLGNEDIAR